MINPLSNCTMNRPATHQWITLLNRVQRSTTRPEKPFSMRTVPRTRKNSATPPANRAKAQAPILNTSSLRWVIHAVPPALIRSLCRVGDEAE